MKFLDIFSRSDIMFQINEVEFDVNFVFIRKVEEISKLL